MRQTPRYHSKRPPYHFFDKHPGAKLADHLSVGDGAISEASTDVIYILYSRKLNAWDVGRYMFCAATAKQTKSDAGTGAGVPALVGAASPGRRKLPQVFGLSSVLISVMGPLSALLDALSALLGCDLRHDQHLLQPCCWLCACERCGLFFLIFCIAPRLRG